MHLTSRDVTTIYKQRSSRINFVRNKIKFSATVFPHSSSYLVSLTSFSWKKMQFSVVSYQSSRQLSRIKAAERMNSLAFKFECSKEQETRWTVSWHRQIRDSKWKNFSWRFPYNLQLLGSGHPRQPGSVHRWTLFSRPQNMPQQLPTIASPERSFGRLSSRQLSTTSTRWKL